MKRTIVWLIVGVIILALAGCGNSGADAAVELGRRTYNTGGVSSVPCVTCHTLDGTELVGPSFQGLKDRAGSTVEGMSAEDYLRESIVDPEAHLVDGYANQMYRDYAKTLTEDEINGLIAFLMAQ